MNSLSFNLESNLNFLFLKLENFKGFTDEVVPTILDKAHAFGLKVCFHHEPYPSRTAQSFRNDLVYIIDKYGDHPAFFRDSSRNNKPIFFVYDSYLIDPSDWISILSSAVSNTIRNGKYDSLVIGLYVDARDKLRLIKGHFDGFYSYFASNGFTQGSSTSQWGDLKKWSSENNLLFIPCVGPGYDDTRIRPWNAINKRDRSSGEYYSNMWKNAVALHPPYVGITSFNEWHEGTQIEPAISKTLNQDYKYSDYTPQSPYFYLNETLRWINILDEN